VCARVRVSHKGVVGAISSTEAFEMERGRVRKRAVVYVYMCMRERERESVCVCVCACVCVHARACARLTHTGVVGAISSTEAFERARRSVCKRAIVYVYMCMGVHVCVYVCI